MINYEDNDDNNLIRINFKDSEKNYKVLNFRI